MVFESEVKRSYCEQVSIIEVNLARVSEGLCTNSDTLDTVIHMGEDVPTMAGPNGSVRFFVSALEIPARRL
jgi:hypothetical protein